LAEDLEKLGPTFVKLGQLLSTRSDFLSSEYLRALERLQDDVEPLSYVEVAGAIEAELGASPDQIFEEFERTPLASASLGQVHRARLPGGAEVVVKIQRPHIRQRVKQELQVLNEVSTTLDHHSRTARRYRLRQMVEELSTSLTRELDYYLEARNLEHFRQQLEPYPGLTVPRPHPEFSTDRVLTMDYVEGTKLPEDHSLIDLSWEHRQMLADSLFKAYLNQVLYDGTYHADPHPGNVLITPDGRLCLLDLGMVGHMPGELQVVLARLLLAIGQRDGDMVAETALDASGRDERCDETRFRRRIAEMVADHHQQPIERMQSGQLILNICEAASENGILVPYELTMLAKTLLNLDEIGRRLAPEFNPSDALERHAPPILLRRLETEFNETLLLDQALELRSALKHGPRLLNNILHDLERGTFTVRVDAIDERELLVSFQKIANRVAVGSIMGALILGAALMMGVETAGPTIFGFPAFAVVCFLGAAAGGGWLVWNVLRQDRISGKELHKPLRGR
ncbi:MAG: AarF/ABC1/UbiB kinase family protein, partial [Candidatus Eremiobacteraeota bacterium]|nr:AarF/ABC1/UbiB kinase family protein [Candidatus Eremiobacteraeota bacterium]